MKQRIKGRTSKEGFYFETLRGGQTYAVRVGSHDGEFIGHVTRMGRNWWKANLGDGITARGKNRSEAVLEAIKKRGETA